jgi:hypothetical protein
MKIHTSLRACGAAAGILALGAGAAAAQVAPTARALGMGGAYVATARGHEALFLNPANLGLPGTPYWSVAIPQLSFAGGVSGPALGDSWDIFQANRQTAARKAELMAGVPAEGMGVDLDVLAPLVTFQNRRLAFGVAYGAVVDHSLGRDLVDMFVNGFESGRTDYQVGNTSGSRATFFDFAVGYGRQVGPVSVGATGHYILGRNLSRARLFDPRIDTRAETIDIEYREVFARGGSGYALDLGAAYQPLPNLTLSAAVANAFARMTWSQELHTRSMTITQRDFDSNSTMHWEEKLGDFSRNSEPVDPAAVPLSVYETAQGLYREAYFPTTLRTGAAYHLPATRTHVEASYRKHLGDGRLGGAWEQVASVGVQQRIPLLTLRAGAATDLDGGSMLSAGLTLGSLEFGLARLSDETPAGAARDGWVGSVGLGIGTRTRMP